MDCYKVLGVKPDSSQLEIKKAYHQKSLELHPDKHPEEIGLYTKAFQDVQSAYGYLKTGEGVGHTCARKATAEKNTRRQAACGKGKKQKKDEGCGDKEEMRDADPVDEFWEYHMKRGKKKACRQREADGSPSQPETKKSTAEKRQTKQPQTEDPKPPKKETPTKTPEQPKPATERTYSKPSNKRPTFMSMGELLGIFTAKAAEPERERERTEFDDDMADQDCAPRPWKNSRGREIRAEMRRKEVERDRRCRAFDRFVEISDFYC